MNEIAGTASPEVASIIDGETESKPDPGLADLLNLFTRPGLFFSGRIELGRRKYLWPAVLLLGIAAQQGRLDSQIIRHDMGSTGPAWALTEFLVTSSWPIFWLYMVLGGAISGLLVYWIGGWWYGVRLRWSSSSDNAKSGINWKAGREVYCWSELVSALPSMLISIFYVLAFPNYLSAYNSDELLSVFLPVMLFWSVAVSYVGATTRFDLRPWKARVWFLIVPAVFYVFALGLIVAVMTYFA